jgi:hypothetical protein
MRDAVNLSDIAFKQEINMFVNTREPYFLITEQSYNNLLEDV